MADTDCVRSHFVRQRTSRQGFRVRSSSGSSSSHQLNTLHNTTAAAAAAASSSSSTSFVYHALQEIPIQLSNHIVSKHKEIMSITSSVASMGSPYDRKNNNNNNNSNNEQQQQQQQQLLSTSTSSTAQLMISLQSICDNCNEEFVMAEHVLHSIEVKQHEEKRRLEEERKAAMKEEEEREAHAKKLVDMAEAADHVKIYQRSASDSPDTILMSDHILMDEDHHEHTCSVPNLSDLGDTISPKPARPHHEIVDSGSSQSLADTNKSLSSSSPPSPAKRQISSQVSTEESPCLGVSRLKTGSSFNLTEFEGHNTSPFETVQLQAIDDREALQRVFVTAPLADSYSEDEEDETNKLPNSTIFHNRPIPRPRRSISCSSASSSRDGRSNNVTLNSTSPVPMQRQRVASLTGSPVPPVPLPRTSLNSSSNNLDSRSKSELNLQSKSPRLIATTCYPAPAAPTHSTASSSSAAISDKKSDISSEMLPPYSPLDSSSIHYPTLRSSTSTPETPPRVPERKKKITDSFRLSPLRKTNKKLPVHPRVVNVNNNVTNGPDTSSSTTSVFEAMGFSQKQIEFSLAVFGGDATEQRIVDFLVRFPNLAENGHSAMNVRIAIDIWDDDTDKIFDCIKVLCKLAPLGFEEEQVREALLVNNNSFEEVLNYLTGERKG